MRVVWYNKDLKVHDEKYNLDLSLILVAKVKILKSGRHYVQISKQLLKNLPSQRVRIESLTFGIGESSNIFPMSKWFSQFTQP